MARYTNGELCELDLPPGVPRTVDEIGYNNAVNQGPNRSKTGGRRPACAVSFGIGSANEARRVEFFCKVVDREMRSCLDETGLPMVIAGETNLVKAYRKENSYPNTPPPFRDGRVPAGGALVGVSGNDCPSSGRGPGLAPVPWSRSAGAGVDRVRSGSSAQRRGPPHAGPGRRGAPGGAGATSRAGCRGGNLPAFGLTAIRFTYAELRP